MDYWQFLSISIFSIWALPGFAGLMLLAFKRTRRFGAYLLLCAAIIFACVSLWIWLDPGPTLH
jgi:hypothetical protein